MSKEFDDLRRRVYGSANPTEEQVQAVRKRAQAPVRKPTGRNPEIKKDALVNAITSSIAKNVTGPGNLRTAQASGRISGGFSGRQDDLPSYISRAAGTATAQSDAVLRTDPVRTQAPNTAANPAGRSAQKDFSLLELLGGTVVKGADEAVSRATSTAAWLERNTIGRLFPGAADDTPIQALNEHFQNVKQENQEAFAPNVEAGGRLAQVVDKYGTSVVSAIPSAALAVMTAGTAPAGLEAAASAASRSPGILSALQASAQNMTKNPQFWNSFFQVAGSSYDEALSLGMSEDEADLYALANGLLSSGVEIGGGLETLPSNLKDSSGALRAWIRGMMEEGREEVVQGAISRGLQNMIGSVGNPLVSATDERAVFNPRTAAEEFTGGAVVGGFLGGGQVLAGRLLNGPTAAQEGAGDSGGAGAPGAQDGAQGVLGQNKPPPEGGMVNENGLHAFSEQERINLSSGKKNKVISTFSEAVSFVKNALSNRQNVDRAYLGKVPDSVARTIRQNTGLDIRGFGVMMNGNDIRHMIKNHGDILTEQARGQVAVTADDIARIPEILAAPDRVYLSDETDTKGRKTLIFEKQIGDQYISIQGVSDGKRVLQTDTLYIRKGRPRTTRDTMPGTESAVPVINAQGEPSQKPSSIDVTIPQDAEYVNSVDPLLRWMLGSRPTAAQEGAGAAAGQKMGTDAAQVRGGSEGVQDAWRDTIVNEVRRNSGIGENESPASTSDGTSALSGDLETVVDAWDMAAIPGTVGTVTDGRASQVAPISTVQETGINVNHQEGQNRIRNTGETVRVVETLRDHIPKLSEAEPVSEVSSNSIPFVSGKTMAEKAKTLFEAIKGIVSRPGFGDIEINTRSVKDDLHHGIGTAKAAVIPAIPDIIRTGTQIDFQENWKGRPYDGYIFAAPVTMDGKTVYVAAVVKRTSKNRFYLHEVVDSDGNIIKIDAGDSANQTSLATNGSAGTQSQASVEGTRPLNPDSIIAPGAENVNPPDGLGAADAGTLGDFTTMQNESDVFHPINQQTQEREIEMGRAPEEVPVINPRTGRNITKTVSTILNSPLTSNEMARTIEASVSEGQFDYAPVTDRAANLRAQQDISKQGLDDVAQYFLAKVDFGQKITKQDMASGIAAYNQAVADGNHMLALNLATAISESAHNSAQVVQAMNLMNRLTPEGKLLALRKFLTRMNRRRQGTQQSRNVNTHSQEDVDAARLDYVENGTGFLINEELATNYLLAETDAERAAAWDAILTNVAQQVPSTFRERANFWRYTSMLLNPTTHARNIAGNAIQWGARKIKNGVGAAIERAVIRDRGQRTKSFTTNKELRSFAKEQYKIDQEAAMGSGKYSDTSAAGINREIQERRKVFSAGTNSILAKGVQAVGDFNTWLMDAGDVLFNRPAYIDSFAQALKAKGITAEQARNGGPEVEAARAYAIQEAQKATYRNTTALSEAVSRMGRYEGDNPVLKAASFLADAELPFRRTPANVLTTGLDYSPVGLARGIKNALWDVRKGNMDAAAAIDRISEGLTGSAIMALGAYLAAEGFLHVRAGGDDDEKEFNQDRGMQDYSLQIGDMSYSLDWALPAAMPLFAGAAVMESVQEADGTFSALADAMTGISEVVLESSMMSSLDDLIANWSYADNKATYLIDDVVTSYLGQYVPTIGGKIASTMDETVRRSYTEPGTGQVSSDAQYFLQSIMKKVPGVRNQLQPSVDLWGNEKSNGSFEERLFQSFVSPGILRTTDTGPIDREIRHLAEATGDSSVYPKEAEKSFAVNGERKDLTAEEYTQYAKVLGQTRYKTIQSLMEDPAYNRLSYDDKAKAISYAYQYATAIGKQAVSAYKPADSSFAKGAINSSLPIESYILYQINSDRNHNGSTDSVESATTLQELTGITNRQRGAAWAQKNSQTSEAKNPFTGALPSAGVSVNTSIAILEKYRALYNDDSMKTREKAQAFKDYVYGLGLSGGQLAAVKETYTWWGSYPVEW